MLTVINYRRIGQPERGLGNVAAGAPVGAAYVQWSQGVDAALQSLWGGAWREHGAATVVPSNIGAEFQQYVGQPAARFDNATYAELANRGLIDTNRPTTVNRSGTLVYVLASGSVMDAAPHTMTALEQAENAIYAKADDTADALGLPSLASIQGFLTGIGRDVLIGVAVTVAVAYVLKRKR